MNKHVVAIGVLGLALAFVADRCVKLEKKLVSKTMECKYYKFVNKIYEILLEETDDADEKKEA